MYIYIYAHTRQLSLSPASSGERASGLLSNATLVPRRNAAVEGSHIIIGEFAGGRCCTDKKGEPSPFATCPAVVRESSPFLK